MRIDMIVEPTDLFTVAPSDIDVEASGRTYAAELTRRLAEEFPGSRVNVWYSPTPVRSEQKFEIHWNGDVDPLTRSDEEARVRERVSALERALADGDDWLVRSV